MLFNLYFHKDKNNHLPFSTKYWEIFSSMTISDLLQKLHVIKNKCMSTVISYTDYNSVLPKKLLTFFAKTKRMTLFLQIQEKIKNIWNKK